MNAASRRSGSGAIQFDLRFYVVALVFLIFEVEVAFFFPPAALFGQSVHMLAPDYETKASVEAAKSVDGVAKSGQSRFR